MGLTIPDYINEKLQNVSSHFGANITDIIENAITTKMSNVSENDLITLNNIFSKKDSMYKAAKESIQEMAQPTNVHLGFWNSILESSNLSPVQKQSINKIKSIFEASDAKDSKRESIEGDGEDPNADLGDGTGVGPDGGDTGDGSDGQDGQDGQDGMGMGMDDGSGDGQDVQITPEQQLQLELSQTDNKFMTISLYDRINELMDTIGTILDNVSSSKTEENLDLFTELNQYKDYLEILAELIFVMDLNTVYYNFTNISLEVNDLLDKYLISTKVKTLNDKDTSPQTKKDIIDDLRQNLSSKIEANKEIHDEENQEQDELNQATMLQAQQNVANGTAGDDSQLPDDSNMGGL